MLAKDHETKYNIVDLKPVNPVESETERKYLVPLDGKWIINSDPFFIGKNFRTLTNMRYVYNHLEGISGIERYTSSVIPNGFIRGKSLFHFQKDNPYETHVLVHTLHSSNGWYAVFDNNNEISQSSSGNFYPNDLYEGVSSTIGRFSNAPGGNVVFCNGDVNCIWGGNETTISALITSDNGVGDDGYLVNPKDYSSEMRNSKEDNYNMFQVGNTFLVGSTRLIDGIKIYIYEPYANTVASTMSARYWNGTTWPSLTITDGTSVGGASLAQDGFVTFSGSTSVPRYLGGYFLYWYQINITTGCVAYISRITLSARMQPIIDIWDGVFRNVGACYKKLTSYEDATMKVLYQDYIGTGTSSTDTYLLANMGVYASNNNCIEVGFVEKITGLYFVVVPGHENATAGTVMSIDYWNGTTYMPVTSLSDGTIAGSGNNASWGKSGVASWDGTQAVEIKSNKSSSVKKDVKSGTVSSTPLYFYRIRFNQAIGSVYIDYIGGITSPKTISGYRFSVHAADRLMLCCDGTEYRNSILISAQDQPQVFNGNDSYRILFGDDKELTCGTSLFAQYASNIYNMALFFKKSETWSLVWQQTESGMSWTRFKVSPNIGCPAPGTLCTASVAFENNVNNVKVLAIWRAEDGIYVSNGQAPLKVSQDIESVFDQLSNVHVNLASLSIESAFIDEHKLEYHWLWSTTTGYLNKEYVLDLKTWKWFEIDRGTGLYLQIGLNVVDLQGNKFTTGMTYDSYYYFLERGTSFNGNNIIQTVETGDQLLIENDILSETSISKACLVVLSKTIDTSVSLTHTTDGYTGTPTPYSMSIAITNKRIASPVVDVLRSPGLFHSFKLSYSSYRETTGLVPLGLAIYFYKERDRTLSLV